jgi:hypothetical protein
MTKETNPTKKRGYATHTKTERLIGIVGLTILATLGVYALGFFYKIKLDERNVLYKNIKTVQHFPVDRIGDYTVYLIVLNGDTLGVTAIK